MSTITEMICLTVITVFVIDISGFTDTWKKWLADFIGKDVKQLKPLKPFTCSLCMTHHTLVIWLLCTGQFTLPYWAFACVLAALSSQIGQFINLIRYAVETAINRLFHLLDLLWKRN